MDSKTIVLLVDETTQDAAAKEAQKAYIDAMEKAGYKVFIGPIPKPHS